MPGLRDIQRSFTQGIFSQTEADGFAAQHIKNTHFSGAQLLQIYRNNIFTNLTQALAAVYPVVARLVGEEFFQHAAHSYIRHHPSANGNLHKFGETFADFLAGLPEAAELLYLADVARLEWHYHTAFHAAEHKPLDPQTLASLPPERYAHLSFSLHPTAALLYSAFPIQRIWQVNQPDYHGDDRVDLNKGADNLLVIRPQQTVIIQRLDVGEFAFLQALQANHNFLEACEAAQAMQAEFDLTSCLQYHVCASTLTAFHLDEQTHNN